MADEKEAIAVAVPVEVQGKVDGGTGLELFEGYRNIVMVQRVDLMEAAANAVGLGCVEQQNKYDFYDEVTGDRLLFAKEESNWFNRCCCKPFHEASVHVYDVRGNVAVTEQKNLYAGDTVDQGPEVMTLEKPFKCGCCFACCDFCRAEGTTHSNGQFLGKSKVPTMGGGFTPVINTMDRADADEPILQSKGPACLIGGLMELCTDFTFILKDPKTNEVIGAVTKKKVEKNGALRQVMTDADTFVISMPASASNEEMARVVGQALLMDFLYFEGGAPISCQGGQLSINCCTLYCCGCTVPCVLKGGGGGE